MIFMRIKTGKLFWDGREEGVIERTILPDSNYLADEKYRYCFVSDYSLANDFVRIGWL